MSKKSFITEKMAVSRMSECVEITDLSEEFRLNNNTPFSLFIRPKSVPNEASVLISAEPYAGNGFRDIPVTLDNWNKYYLSAIAANGINLSKYRVWWGTGGAASKAEPPAPPIPPTPMGIPFTEIPIGYNLRGKIVRFTRTDLPVPEMPFPQDEGGLDIIQGIFWDRDTLSGIVGLTEGTGEGRRTMIVPVERSDGFGIFYQGDDEANRWYMDSFLMRDDKDYIITANQTKPAEAGFWGWNYAYVMDAPLPAQPKLTELPSGYNLRGKTIEFTNTDKYVPNPGMGLENTQALAINGFFPGDANGFLILAGETYSNWQIVFSGSSGGGLEDAEIFAVHQVTGEQIWLTTTITLPDDKDYLVGTNALKPHEGSNWGFDYAIVR